MISNFLKLIYQKRKSMNFDDSRKMVSKQKFCFTTFKIDHKAYSNERNSLELVTFMAKLAQEMKGKNVMILDVSHVVDWTSYLCIVTALNRTHGAAMLSKLEKTATKYSYPRFNNNRCSSGDWILLD